LSISSKFSQPLLIYDDKCSSCGKFAKVVARLSKGWIRIAGHYYSQEAINTKKMIFPHDYDATKMFWLINKKGAYGARSGLVQVIKEIILGNFKSMLKNHFNKKYDDDLIISCNYHGKESCMSTKTTLIRIFDMIKNGDKFTFN
jgi:hypothetical protein